MPDRFTEHLHRGHVTVAVIGKLGRPADLTEARMTAYQAEIATVETKQDASIATETAKNVKNAQNRERYRKLWLKLKSFYAVASVTGSPDALAALDTIETGTKFSDIHCLKRARETKGALSGFEDDYAAAGLDTTTIETEIAAALTADDEEQALIVADKLADEELKKADLVLDKENKAIYKILKNSFPEGSPELATVEAIPTEGEASPVETDVPSVPGGTGSGGTPHLPTDLPA